MSDRTQLLDPVITPINHPDQTVVAASLSLGHHTHSSAMTTSIIAMQEQVERSMLQNSNICRFMLVSSEVTGLSTRRVKTYLQKSSLAHFRLIIQRLTICITPSTLTMGMTFALSIVASKPRAKTCSNSLARASLPVDSIFLTCFEFH